MSYDGKLLAKAKTRLDELRSAGEAERLKHLSQVYEALPEVRRIDGRIRANMANAVKCAVSGDTGRLKVFDPKPVVENLALGGVPEAARANVAKALTDLTYSVLRLSLHPEEGGGMALAVKLAGSATHNGVTVPVSFEVTFHGDVEQLVNTGLKTALRKKK